MFESYMGHTEAKICLHSAPDQVSTKDDKPPAMTIQNPSTSQNTPKNSQKRRTVIILSDSSDDEQENIHTLRQSSQSQTEEDVISDSSIEIITPAKIRRDVNPGETTGSGAVPPRSTDALQILGPSRQHTNPQKQALNLPEISKSLSASGSSRNNSSTHSESPPLPDTGHSDSDSFDEGALLLYIPNTRKKLVRTSTTHLQASTTPPSPSTSKVATSSHTVTYQEGKFSILSPSKRRRKSLASDFGSRRDQTCLQLVQDLDEDVFDRRLPEDLKIIWSKRSANT